MKIGLFNTYIRFRRALHVIKLQLSHLELNCNEYDYTISYNGSLEIPHLLDYDTSFFIYDGSTLKVKNRMYDKAWGKIKTIQGDKIVGIESWVSDCYSLVPVKCRRERPLLLDNDFYIYWYDGALYKKKDGIIIRLCEFCLPDIMYCDMIRRGRYYVLRSGPKIFVSTSLDEWKIIYEGKRGIKDSMIFVGNGNDTKVLFIEYTPGAIREHHHVYSYSLDNGELKLIQLFYTHKEFLEKQLTPCARHIHVIAEDPYTSYIYVATGDNNDESGIFVSRDLGNSFEPLFVGSQQYRALSFIFSKDCVLWNTDTHETQSIYSYNKKKKQLNRYALINGALWCSLRLKESIHNEDFYIMCSNSEGALYDNNNRVYGIILKGDEPVVYELLKKRSHSIYSQQFVLGQDDRGIIYFYDQEYDKVRAYKLLVNPLAELKR